MRSEGWLRMRLTPARRRGCRLEDAGPFCPRGPGKPPRSAESQTARAPPVRAAKVSSWAWPEAIPCPARGALESRISGYSAARLGSVEGAGCSWAGVARAHGRCTGCRSEGEATRMVERDAHATGWAEQLNRHDAATERMLNPTRMSALPIRARSWRNLSQTKPAAVGAGRPDRLRGWPLRSQHPTEMASNPFRHSPAHPQEGSFQGRAGLQRRSAGS